MAEIGGAWSAEDIDTALRLLDESGGKLPAGQRHLPAELVHVLQRERLLAAMLKAAADLGYRALSVQDVLRGAGVSRPTFYDHFTNKEDCFIAAFDSAATRLLALVETAVEEGGKGWRRRLGAGLEALLRFAGEEPDAARTLIVEARAASTLAQQRREALLDRFAGCIDEQVRSELSVSPAPSASVAAVGGIEALLFSRLYEDRDEEIEALLPALTYLAALPFAGAESGLSRTG